MRLRLRFIIRMDLDFDPVGVVLTAQGGGGDSPPPPWAVSEKKHPRPVGAVHWRTIAAWDSPVNGPYRAGAWLACIPRPEAAKRRLRPGLLERPLQGRNPNPFRYVNLTVFHFPGFIDYGIKLWLFLSNDKP